MMEGGTREGPGFCICEEEDGTGERLEQFARGDADCHHPSGTGGLVTSGSSIGAPSRRMNSALHGEAVVSMYEGSTLGDIEPWPKPASRGFRPRLTKSVLRRIQSDLEARARARAPASERPIDRTHRPGRARTTRKVAAAGRTTHREVGSLSAGKVKGPALIWGCRADSLAAVLVDLGRDASLAQDEGAQAQTNEEGRETETGRKTAPYEGVRQELVAARSAKAGADRGRSRPR